MFCPPNFLNTLGYGVLQTTRKALAAIFVTLAMFSAAKAQPVVIAALGDSLTQGYGLPAEKGFVPQLRAALLSAGHDVEMINAGVSGDTTAGGLARMDWTLEPRVQGVIVTLGGNDVLRGIDPSVSRGNIKAILEKSAARNVQVLLVGMQAPLNFGPDYKSSFDAIYPDLAAEFQTLLYPSFMAGLEGDGSLEAVQNLMQGDGIHPNEEGVSRIVADILPSVEALIAEINAN